MTNIISVQYKDVVFVADTDDLSEGDEMVVVLQNVAHGRERYCDTMYMFPHPVGSIVTYVDFEVGYEPDHLRAVADVAEALNELYREAKDARSSTEA